MLLIPKPHMDPPLLCTVVNLCEQNKNTIKIALPLPDIDGVLRHMARKRYHSMLDLKNAYEQTWLMCASAVHGMNESLSLVI